MLLKTSSQEKSASKAQKKKEKSYQAFNHVNVIKPHHQE